MKTDACSEVATFKAKKGVYVTGSVQPPIEGVKIEVVGMTGVETDANGAFKIGPVPSEDADNLNLSATKEGYYFTQKSGENAHFTAHKLATISIEVKTKSGMKSIKIGLPGKLILRDYFQEDMTSQRPFLLPRISFP